MSKVIKHAVVYTGEDKIDDAYIRFDEQIEAIGPMSEYRVSPADQEVIDVEGKLIVPGFLSMYIVTVAIILMPWMVMQKN